MARLFHTAHPELAQQALEALLAGRPPQEVPPQAVESIYREYSLGKRHAAEVAAAVWRTALTAFVADDLLTQVEWDYLVALRRLLDVGEDAVIAAERDIVHPRFQRAVDEVLTGMLAKGPSAELNQQLNQLVTDYRLPESDQKRVFADAGQAFVERTMAHLDIVRRLTDLERKTVEGIIRALDVPVDKETNARIWAYYLMWYFESGQPIEPQTVPVNLHKQEVCLSSFEVAWETARARDIGSLYVTSERVVFEGGSKNATITYQSLLGTQRDGVYVALKKASGPGATVQFVLPEFAELATVVIQRALAERSRGVVHRAQPKTPDQPSPPPVRSAPQPSVEAPALPRHSVAVNQRRLDELLDELSTLIGLASVKHEVASLTNLIKVQALRKAQGLPVPPMSYHLVFTGNPGTGKTTVARVLGGVFGALGLLEKGHLVETDRSGLVGGYVGQTAIKTQGVIQQALGGVLFIDEAYALAANQSSEDYGHEAIDTILKMMEDHRDNLIVVAAGYSEPMKTFLESNPGLKSRFTRFIDFPDYDPDELFTIFESMVQKAEYRLTPEAAARARDLLAAQYAQREAAFGNARLVRNFFERTVARNSDRLAAGANLTKEELSTVQAIDLPVGETFH
jgi:hypothetical protein